MSNGQLMVVTKDHLEELKAEIHTQGKLYTQALGGDEQAYRTWLAAVLVDMENQPKLVEAARNSPESLHMQLGIAASCRLIPGSAHGLFYLIPRFSGKLQRTQVTSIIGYKGLMDLAYRHPRVRKIDGAVVFKGEVFDYSPGTGELVHKWNPEAARTWDNILCAYSRVILGNPEGMGGGTETSVMVMTKAQLEETRDNSDGYVAYLNAQKKGWSTTSPWVDHFQPMCQKTVFRRHMNSGMVPKSNEVLLVSGRHIDKDEREEDDIPQVEASSEPAKPAVPGAGVERLKVAITGFDPKLDADLVGGGGA